MSSESLKVNGALLFFLLSHEYPKTDQKYYNNRKVDDYIFNPLIYCLIPSI
jgi:hypothetical protein